MPLTAVPKELKESASLLKNGADKTESIIKEALTTDGVKPDTVQRTNKTAMQSMLLSFLLAFNKSSIEGICCVGAYMITASEKHTLKNAGGIFAEKQIYLQ